MQRLTDMARKRKVNITSYAAFVRRDTDKAMMMLAVHYPEVVEFAVS